MQPFTSHTGKVAGIDRVNVDTDQMIPKQFCKWVTREGYGRVLFYNWRYTDGVTPDPDFILNHERYQGASVLIARANFACGSSREHAVWGVLDYGFRVVLAPSFGDIFYNNSFKNGLLPVRLPSKVMDDMFQKLAADESYEVSVDLETQKVTDNHGLEESFEIDPGRKERLLNGLDDISLTLALEDKIAAYEKTNPRSATMFDPVDLTVTGPK